MGGAAAEELSREYRQAFWKKVKAKGGTRINVGMESKHGTMLTERNEVKCRWKEHFSELLGVSWRKKLQRGKK